MSTEYTHKYSILMAIFQVNLGKLAAPSPFILKLHSLSNNTRSSADADKPARCT